MERGAAIAVLGLVGLVSLLAIVSLLFQHPTGNVAQNEGFYPTEYLETLPIPCATSTAYFLRSEGAYEVYCCSEDLIGQNTCRRPQYIRLA